MAPLNTVSSGMVDMFTCGGLTQCFGDDDNGDVDAGEYSKTGYTYSSSLPTLSNPTITVSYLSSNLFSKTTPRMILTYKRKKQLLYRLQSDYVLQNMAQMLQRFTQIILYKTSVVTRVLEGKRLLKVSRQLLYRVNVLCMYYILNGSSDSTVLSRIDAEILAACNFEDWNPSHFLDVAEICMAIALAVDWVGDELPESTVTLAKSSLIEKGLEASFASEYWWINSRSNWNQVCHGGLVAAAICVAEVYPDLAATTLQRAMESIPYGLSTYGPDGVYPEGASYWEYGTSYSVLTADILTTAFGTDFGITSVSGFQESATFRSLCKAPSGRYYNFSDCGDNVSNDGDLVLAWFASQTSNSLFYEKQKFLRTNTQMGKPHNIVGAGMVWLSQYEGDVNWTQLPSTWKGEGTNPVVFFTSSSNYNSSSNFYFACKGGKGNNGHGNIDGGSFVFELNGVRWVVDPGSQSYNNLEQNGIDLWNMSQDSSRWDLLTKNNFGHSTLTVNSELHSVSGMTTIVDYNSSSNTPSVTLDMTAAFSLNSTLSKALRTFTKTSSSSLLIEDYVELSDYTESITWQLITTASVTTTTSGAVLTQNNQQLNLTLLSTPAVTPTVVSLYPAPLDLDRQIEGLCRIEFTFTASDFSSGSGKIQVELSG